MNLETIKTTLSDKGICIIKYEDLKSTIKLAQKEYFASMESCVLAPQKQQFHYRDHGQFWFI